MRGPWGKTEYISGEDLVIWKTQLFKLPGQSRLSLLSLCQEDCSNWTAPLKVGRRSAPLIKSQSSNSNRVVLVVEL